MPKSPQKILIISNCQVQPLKHGLAIVCDNVDIDAVPVHVISVQERAEVFAKYIADKAKYSFVLSIALSEDFGDMARDKIKDSFYPTPVLTISNLHFLGLHPDITYIGGLSQRAPGPIGDYHSQLALLAFLMKLSPEDAVQLYCDRIYRHMGYYDAFGEALDELARRDADTDIPIGDLLESRLREGVCFLSQNHPTNFLMAPYISKISQHLADMGLVTLSGLVPRPEETINFLASSSIFPIYPELAAHHNLPYSGSYVFRAPTIGDVPAKPLSLKTFVEGEFEAFRNGDLGLMKNNYPGNWLTYKYAEDPAFRELAADLSSVHI